MTGANWKKIVETLMKEEEKEFGQSPEKDLKPVADMLQGYIKWDKFKKNYKKAKAKKSTKDVSGLITKKPEAIIQSI